MMRIPEQGQSTGIQAGKQRPLSASTLISREAQWGEWKWTVSFTAPVLELNHC
jgi:hypothetical protein